MKTPKILVVGSLVTDLITKVHTLPVAGETRFGHDFTTAPGGKGANQAVQARLLGADVTMVGRVGADANGEYLRTALKSYGLSDEHIGIDSKVSTAVGNIILETGGERTQNRIIVVPGANMAITTDDVAFLANTIGEYDMVILQLEIPMQVNRVVAEYARAAGVPVMLNSAPYVPIDDDLLAKLAYISPNETEAAAITGVPIRREGKDVNFDDVRKAIDVLREKGVPNVIITLGSAGAAFGNADGIIFSPCIDIVKVQDPTAAGDSFVGAFCYAVSSGMGYEQALKFANYTATLTVSKMGAMPSLPTLDQVLALMATTEGK